MGRDPHLIAIFRDAMSGFAETYRGVGSGHSQRTAPYREIYFEYCYDICDVCYTNRPADTRRVLAREGCITTRLRTHYRSQKVKVAAMQMAEKKVCAHLS